MQEKKFESRKQEYLYQLLDRLRTDCEYYLGNGNHHPQALWAGDEEGQISKMREIWNQLEEKPEWLTWEDINEYADKMGVVELPSTRNNTVAKEIQDMLDRNYEKEKKVGLEEADINTSKNNNVDLEKEKEEVEQQLQDVEELQAKKKELDDKVDELFEAKITDYIDEKELDDIIKTNSILNVANSYKILDNMILQIKTDMGYSYYKIIKNDDDSLEAYWISSDGKKLGDPFILKEVKTIKVESQVSNYTLEEIGQCLKDKGNDFKMQITGPDSKTKWLNIDKDDVQKIYNTLSYKKKKTESLDTTVDLFEQANDLYNSNAISAWQLFLIGQMVEYIDYNIENSNITIDDLVRLSEEFNIEDSDILSIINNFILENIASKFDKLDESIYDNLDLEPGSEEEAQYNELNDRNFKDEFNALSKEEQKAYLDLVPENLGPVSAKLLNKIAEHDGLDKDILYWVVNIRGGKIEESSNKDKIKGFPSSDKTSTKLSYSDIKEVYTDKEKFKKIFTNAQLKWLILNDFDVDELYEGLKELLSTFRNESFKDIISIDEYINELSDNDLLEESNEANLTFADLKKIIDENDFEINEYSRESGEKYWEIAKYTPMGEDWHEVIDGSTVAEFTTNLASLVNDLDIEEMVAPYIDMMGTHGVPDDEEGLRADAEWKRNELNDLLEAIYKVMRTGKIEESVEDNNNEIFNGDTEVNLKLIDGTIIHIACDSNGEGYYYEIYDNNGDEIDGGLMEYEDGEVDKDVPVKEVIKRIADFIAVPALLDKDTIRIGDDEFVKLTDKLYDSDDYYYILPNGKYLTFHKSLSEDGIDYTLYNEDGNEDDGGILEIDTNNNSKEDILAELLKFIGLKDINSLDVDEIDEEIFDSLINS